MMNQQEYVKAWQGAAFTFNKMYEQSFLVFYYSVNSFENYYWNETALTDVVFP